MSLWKKRRGDDFSIDFETMEEIFEELIDVFDEEELDFSKPLKLGFNVSLDDRGSLRINEFGLLQEKKIKQKKREEPFVELIDYENEFLVVVQTNTFSPEDIDIKVLDHALIISKHDSKKFLKKLTFPVKVRTDSVKTEYNNSVLEIRLKKNSSTKSRVKS